MNVKRIDLWYPGVDTAPRTADQPQEVEIGLIHVRAADTIRVRYDFDRDGYVILMRPSREVDYGMEQTGDWQEQAFIPAWKDEPPAIEGTPE